MQISVSRRGTKIKATKRELDTLQDAVAICEQVEKHATGQFLEWTEDAVESLYGVIGVLASGVTVEEIARQELPALVDDPVDTSEQDEAA